ncbi:DUF2071 domain-containing protein [Polluticoccus soli]|uniref:DUF2071 domain-containing protein n=1 Tax=Polluticoccus soli TaxID=3034150 RepID=UPI0023E09A41|nr:DUF2071 domain-containing protein [Flavipsychrobacter sp. JY13-12]
MFQFLRNHPFAVEAFFDSSIVLTFAFPKNDLQSLIPECLKLDCFDDKWAFVAVALVQTSKLRPKGFPEIMGNDFFLIGYRVFVRYKNNSGKRLRGLYILRSQTDKKRMELLGNTFTHYRYSTIDITQTKTEDEVQVSSLKGGLKIELGMPGMDIPLPEGSPFADWKEARRFAGPLPFTFSYLPDAKNVLIVQGVRSNWDPMPIRVNRWNVSMLAELGLNDAVLANAFAVSDVPYHWEKGKLESWNG